MGHPLPLRGRNQIMYHSKQEVRTAVREALYSGNAEGICRILDGREYDQGELEALRSATQEATRVLVNLFFVLIEKRILTESDAVNCIYAYGSIADLEDDDDHDQKAAER